MASEAKGLMGKIGLLDSIHWDVWHWRFATNFSMFGARFVVANRKTASRLSSVRRVRNFDFVMFMRENVCSQYSLSQT